MNARLQLTGNGKLNIADGNLWTVPILAQLGKLLDITFLSRLSGGRLSGLGRISALDADLEFKGDRVAVPRFSTDGTILSLQGQGDYWWPTGKVDFSVKGETLSGVNVLWVALKPLSWVFDARLTGTLDKHDWRMASGLRRVLTGENPDRSE